MASGTISYGIESNGFVTEVRWSSVSDIANNRSTVTAKLYFINTKNLSIGSRINSVTIDGTAYSLTSNAISTKGEHYIGQAVKTVNHLASGSKSITITGVFKIQATLSSGYHDNITATGTAVLDNIPRTSIPTLSSGTVPMGTSFTVYTNRASTSFTHTVRLAGSNWVVVLGTGVATSVAFTPTVADFAPYVTGGTSLSANIVMETYNGSTYVGEASVPIILTVPSNVVPSIGTVTHVEQTANLATVFAQYVQGKSKIKFTIPTSGAYGSTITNISTTFNGVTYSGSTFTTGFVTGSGTLPAVTTITDSRGRTATKTTNVSVTAYTPPSITTFTGFRSNSAGTAQDDGTYARIQMKFSVASVGSKNTKSWAVHRLSGGSWVSVNSGSTYTYDSAFTTGAVFNADITHQLRLTVSDYFTSQTAYFDLPTAFTLMDIRSTGRGIQFGGVSNTDDFRVSMPSVFTTEARFNARPAMEKGIRFNNGSAVKLVGWGGWYGASSTNVGSITIHLGSVSMMLDMRISIRSYNAMMEVHVGGYTYTSTTEWHNPQAFGGLYANIPISVRFTAIGANRYIHIGDINTDWGGYLHVNVDEVNIGYGTAPTEPFGVALQTAYSGSANATFPIYPYSQLVPTVSTTADATCFRSGGFQVIRWKKSVSTQIMNASGGMYFSNTTLASADWPWAFSEAPSVAVLVHGGGQLTWAGIPWSPSPTSCPAVYIYKGSSDSTVRSYAIDITASGKYN